MGWKWLKMPSTGLNYPETWQAGADKVVKKNNAGALEWGKGVRKCANFRWDTPASHFYASSPQPLAHFFKRFLRSGWSSS